MAENTASFRHIPNTQTIVIEVGSKKATIPVELFVKFEPTYRLPMQCIGQTYIAGKAHTIIGPDGVGYSMGDSWKDGDRYLTRIDELCNLEQYETTETLDSILVAHGIKKTLDPISARRAEYPQASELVVALWEHIVEGNSTKLNQLQAKRLAIKDKYPKVQKVSELSPKPKKPGLSDKTDTSPTARNKPKSKA